MMAQLDPKVSWYVARSSGLVAWAVVTASVVVGLALSTKFVRRRGVPAQLLDLHRYLGTLSVVFVAIHLVGLWADSFVHFGPSELFVPFASSWRPAATAWGVLAFYVLAAIQLTSWAMRRLPRRLWHAVHMTSLGLFAAATVHGFQAGADAANLAIEWMCLTGATLVLFLVIFRLLAPRRATRRPVSRADQAAA